jgi:hypothetical protein
MQILPVPESLLLFHGIFKMICAGLASILFWQLFKKYKKRPTRIATGFLYVFIFLILGNVFSAFDNLFGWDNLLGPQTWLGYGIGQIFSALGNGMYLWLYIEIFRVKDRWTGKQRIGFSIFMIAEVFLAIIFMTHYLLGVPPDIFLYSALFMGLTAIIYISWILGSLKLYKTVEDKRFRQKFLDLLIMAILFFFVIVFLVIAGLSEVPSFASWFGLVLMLIGMRFAYLGIIQE